MIKRKKSGNGGNKLSLFKQPGLTRGTSVREHGGALHSVWNTISSLWQRVWDLPFWARELVRKSLHIGVVVLALPLRWVGWWYGLIFAFVALLWNAFGMPRYFRFTFRDEEERAGYSQGMLSYPVSVFALVILFPLPIAASQWATLSFGDGFATLIGRFLGKTKLPWSKDKSVMGMMAFLVMGTMGATFFFWFTMHNVAASSFLWHGSWVLSNISAMSFAEVVLVCVISTAVAAVVETIPFKYVDDNVAAPAAGALTKLLLCLFI